RLAMYEKRMQLEEEGVDYRIVKEKFLNYRQFSCRVTRGKSEVIPAYALAYSTLPRKRAQGRVEQQIGDLHYVNREDIKFLTLDTFNRLAERSYQSVKALIFNPPAFDEEVALRAKLGLSLYDLTPLIVVDEVPPSKLTVTLDAKVYEDTKERLITL
ncbi:MAG: diacylglucosamine hydrolase like protein, partial [Sulfurimonadaceae bacterium]|nr:diacylglucosamine hydrolase like protein [Sulfurimonadaceae bacterium]